MCRSEWAEHIQCTQDLTAEHLDIYPTPIIRIYEIVFFEISRGAYSYDASLKSCKGLKEKNPVSKIIFGFFFKF